MATLTGKVALVTGASGGIGRATALALADAGASVIVHYGKSEQDAEGVVAAIRNNGGKADSAGAELSRPEGASELAAKVRALAADRLDILVASAGISKAFLASDGALDHRRQHSRRRRIKIVVRLKTTEGFNHGGSIHSGEQ